MEALCQKFSQMSGVPVYFEIAPGIPAMANFLEITIYRIFQEALTNIARHAQAKRVWVDMLVEDGSIHLTVQDDGIGFSPEDPSGKGMGLTGILERLELVNGQFDIRSKPGRGTVLAARIPIDASLNEPAEVE
jgi:two-component system sensor histidine kinase UhpB